MNKLLSPFFLFVFIFFMSIFVASSVMSEEWVESGSTYYLYGTCMDAVHQDATITTSVFCKAFIRGSVITHNYYTSYYNFPRQYCLPSGISEKKILGIFIKFVEENYNFIDKPAITTLHHALKQSFPCAESQASK